MAPTCDLQAFIVSQFFSEEPSHNQFRAPYEANLFLHQSLPEHSSTNQFGGKIHLSRARDKRIMRDVSLVTMGNGLSSRECISAHLILHYNIMIPKMTSKLQNPTCVKD